MLSQRPRVLVVEDDTPIRLTLELALRAEGYEVRAEPDGCDLEAVARRSGRIWRCSTSGCRSVPTATRMAVLLRRSSDVPLLFLTAADAVDDRLAGFEAGADDYLIKPFSMAELLARAQALLRRAGRLSSRTWQIGDLVIDDGARSVARGDTRLELTRTEYDLLAMLAQHVGKVLSKTQLLTAVWGFDAYDANLVEVHMSALRRKIETAGPRVIHTVRGAGYVLRG